MNWRRRLKGFARQFGLDIVRFHPETSDSAKVRAVLRYLNIDLVLDVGANTGQYAQGLREGGYRGRIVSFEPLTSAHASLERNAARGVAGGLSTRVARSATAKSQITINVAGNSVSSSVLPMLAQHANSAPESRYIGSETVPLSRLDSAAAPYLVDAGGVYLKIDTQGFEAVVLAGASEFAATVPSRLQLELSLVPLYEGQRLWRRLLGRICGQGFRALDPVAWLCRCRIGTHAANRRRLRASLTIEGKGPAKALIAAHLNRRTSRLDYLAQMPQACVGLRSSDFGPQLPPTLREGETASWARRSRPIGQTSSRCA